MRFSVSPEDRYTYRDEGEITFAEMLTPEEIEAVQRDSGDAVHIGQKRAFAQILAELTRAKRLRWAGCEVVQGMPVPTLEAIKSIQGLTGGVAFALDGESAGSATFFSSFKPFTEKGETLYFTVAYAKPDALYVYNADDPDTHALKELGYVFGDRLRDETHPLLT